MKKENLFLNIIFLTVISITGISQTVKQVTIGSQIWMSENLNVCTFKNGDSIKEARSLDEWNLADENKQAAWCYFSNDSLNAKIKKYGKLYNLYAVIDPRGLAPEGWHVCSSGEVGSLMMFVGGALKAGANLKSLIIDGKDIYYNKYKFSGLSSGYRDLKWNFFGDAGKYWTTKTSEYEGKLFAEYFMLAGYASELYIHTGAAGEGFSVRCIKD
jgi:uncharacterized protein (TIGR02145 family)